MDIKRQSNQAESHASPASVRPPIAPRRPIAFMVLTIIFILIMFGSILISAFVVKSTLTSEVSTPDRSKYQAVFMTNGQVYFGKLTGVTSHYQTLTDVYYLQVQQDVQPAPAAGSDSTISLTKLGEELHGPTDKMNIAQDQILFWEDLKDESAVAKAIEQYKSR